MQQHQHATAPIAPPAQQKPTIRETVKSDSQTENSLKYGAQTQRHAADPHVRADQIW